MKILLDKHSIIHGISIFCWFPTQTRRDEKKIENFLLTTWKDKLNENKLNDFIHFKGRRAFIRGSKPLHPLLSWLWAASLSTHLVTETEDVTLYQFSTIINLSLIHHFALVKRRNSICDWNSFQLLHHFCEWSGGNAAAFDGSKQKLIIGMKKFEIRADEWAEF